MRINRVGCRDREKFLKVARDSDKRTFMNREWRINNLYKIQTKKRETITFVRNEVQNELAEIRKDNPRVLVLKSRQHGITTNECIEALDDVLHKKNFVACIIAHKKPDVQKIFRKVKFAYDNFPKEIFFKDGRRWQKPLPKYDNVNELFFPGTGSRIYVSLEVRGDTVHRLHVSEAHFIPDAFDRIAAASLQAVPEDGIVTMETTANGVGGYFYEMWQEAEDNPKAEWTPLFFGWARDKENYIDPPRGMVLTGEEIMIKQKYGLSDGQLEWRRRKKKELKHLFNQEHPIDAEEAFLFSGNPAFERSIIKDWPVREPIRTEMDGMIKIYHEPKKDRDYVAAVDVAEGIQVNVAETSGAEGGADFSVIEILDQKTGKQMAEFRGRYPFSKLHEIVKKMCENYNNAFVGVESNNHGNTVLSNLVKVYPEDRIYQEEITETQRNVAKKKRKRLGWQTNLRSKPLMIDDLDGAIREEAIKVFSNTAQKECLRYIIDENGKYNAEEGYHDDTVVALAIAYQMKLRYKAMVKFYSKEQLGF